MLKIHHLGHSQSERIVWLCEELGVPYTLRHYTRDPVTRLAPPELKALHPLGGAPVIEDGELLLAESGAIVEYIIHKHGHGHLKLAPEHADYAHFLYWFHFANSNLMPAIVRLLFINRLALPTDNPVQSALQGRLDRALALIDERLRSAPHLAGSEFTAADIMNVFALSTMRLFQPLDLAPYPGIRRYLQHIGQRPAYQRAMAKSDPDLIPMLA
jgi:glutathione S-transferase